MAKLAAAAAAENELRTGGNAVAANGYAAADCIDAGAVAAVGSMCGDIVCGATEDADEGGDGDLLCDEMMLSMEKGLASRVVVATAAVLVHML